MPELHWDTVSEAGQLSSHGNMLTAWLAASRAGLDLNPPTATVAKLFAERIRFRVRVNPMESPVLGQIRSSFCPFGIFALCEIVVCGLNSFPIRFPISSGRMQVPRLFVSLSESHVINLSSARLSYPIFMRLAQLISIPSHLRGLPPEGNIVANSFESHDATSSVLLGIIFGIVCPK